MSGYANCSRDSVADADLDRFIDLRVEALRRWLGDLESAPIGIRTASSEWLTTLRSFVATRPPDRPLT